MRHTRWQPVLAVLIGVNLAFIWGNSLLAGAQSSQVSGGVMELVYRLLPFLPREEWVHGLIRKLGHFSEFALLGLLCAAHCAVRIQRIPLGLLGAGLAAACVDETIQLYVPGRGVQPDRCVDRCLRLCRGGSGGAARLPYHPKQTSMEEKI